MWSDIVRKAVTLTSPALSRSISVSSCCRGKRNFRKFVLPYRGSKIFRAAKARGECPANYGPGPRGPEEPYVKLPDGSKKFIPEMIPDMIVPDLTDCQFKPYVSYQAPDVYQSAFTPEQLFNAVYGPKIVKDFNDGKLGSDGEPLEPSAAETLTPEEAFLNARKTGSDIF